MADKTVCPNVDWDKARARAHVRTMFLMINYIDAYFSTAVYKYNIVVHPVYPV
jgi:hypothetical protein